MFISTQVASNVATIKLQGKFGFSDHRDFRKVVKDKLTSSCTTLEIDFAGVEYLDSSALGMLLLSREEANEVGKGIALVNCRGTVAQVLDIANFQRLFPIR